MKPLLRPAGGVPHIAAGQLIEPNELLENPARFRLDGLGFDELDPHAGSREYLNTTPRQPPIPSREQATPDLVREIAERP